MADDASSSQSHLHKKKDFVVLCALILAFAFVLYLRNRKHFLCFYRVVETRVEVWENEKCCGNTSHRRVFPQLFRVLPNLHECFYNSIETRRKCFLFLLENSPRKITKNEENLIVLFIIKTYILYATQCTRHLNLNCFVFLSSYRNTIINQSARVFSWGYFLINSSGPL